MGVLRHALVFVIVRFAQLHSYLYYTKKLQRFGRSINQHSSRTIAWIAMCDFCELDLGSGITYSKGTHLLDVKPAPGNTARDKMHYCMTA